jgi:hypothetical protein
LAYVAVCVEVDQVPAFLWCIPCHPYRALLKRLYHGLLMLRRRPRSTTTETTPWATRRTAPHASWAVATCLLRGGSMGGCAHEGRKPLTRARPLPSRHDSDVAEVPSILQRWISSTKQAHAGDSELAAWSGSGVWQVGPLT